MHWLELGGEKGGLRELDTVEKGTMRVDLFEDN